MLAFPPALRPWLMSAGTGLALILAFPRFDLGFLAWVALVPLLVAVGRAERFRRAFALGCVAGFVFFAGTHYWIRLVMKNYGGLGELASTGIFLAFCAIMALYFALFGGLAWLIVGQASTPAVPESDVAGAAEAEDGNRSFSRGAKNAPRFSRGSVGLLGRGSVGLLGDARVLLAIPALWVAIELLRSTILTGLPFLLLGYALADHLLIAQAARFGGVYLLSFLAALFNTGIFLLIRNPSRRRGTVLAVALFALALLSGAGVLVPTPHPNQPAYLIQAYASLDERYTPDATRLLILNLEQRAMAAWARNDALAGLIVWPEVPASIYYDDPQARQQLAVLARQTQSPMLVNVIAFADAAHKEALNSAVLIGPAGEVQGRYDKIHLVPFGEYVPYKPLFFFAGTLTAEVSDFAAGARPEPLGGQYKYAPLICYESIFPDLVRQFTARGANVLVNMSNDAWYGKSAAREQLLLMARMRAIENGRWLLRATNTGLTAVIDPYGRAQLFPPGQRAVYTARFGYLSGETVYVAWGHWFPVFAALAALLLLIQAVVLRRRGSGGDDQPRIGPKAPVIELGK